MADLPPNPSPTGDTDNTPVPSGGSTARTRRWVNVLGIIALILILLFGVWLLAAGGHGPGRHAPSGDVDGRTWIASGHESLGGALPN
jgi:hypothetical protein